MPRFPWPLLSAAGLLALAACQAPAPPPFAGPTPSQAPDHSTVASNPTGLPQLPPEIPRVGDDLVIAAAKTVARNQTGMIGLAQAIAACARDVGARAETARIQYCFALDVLVSNIAAGHDRATGAKPLPGLSWGEAQQRFALYMAALHLPPRYHQSMLDDLTARTTPAYQRIAALDAQPAEIYEGQTDGAAGKMRLSSNPDGSYHLRLEVAGTHCFGAVEGTLRSQGPVLVMTRADGSGGGVCELSLGRKGADRLQLSEEQCAAYHGPACGFSGEFRRIQ